LEQLSLEENFQFRNNSSADVFAMCILGIYERVASHFLIQSKTNTTTLREISTDAVNFIIGGIKDITKKYGDR
ncbi:MAG: hypothetical protein U9N77_00325, partial [Thermodesulfobacteriota bacterium]|nr:hypothetical protein [Thermodesulfobacteriota bacterium]